MCLILILTPRVVNCISLDLVLRARTFGDRRDVAARASVLVCVVGRHSVSAALQRDALREVILHNISSVAKRQHVWEQVDALMHEDARVAITLQLEHGAQETIWTWVGDRGAFSVALRVCASNVCLRAYAGARMHVCICSRERATGQLLGPVHRHAVGA